jgi:hypothetical protein
MYARLVSHQKLLKSLNLNLNLLEQITFSNSTTRIMLKIENFINEFLKMSAFLPSYVQHRKT